MWVIPFVSGGGQEPAVNIATAHNLSKGYASFGRDRDRIAVYAHFGPGEKDRIPLIEIPTTNGDDGPAWEAADREIKRILDAVKIGEKVFDMHP